MNKQIVGRDAALTLLGIAGGLILGILVSDYYYVKGVAERREGLIDSAASDIEMWHSKDAYPMLHDSAAYTQSGAPWPMLVSSGLSELSRNTHEFVHLDDFREFRSRLLDCERKALDFNDRVLLRNLAIVAATNMPGLTAEMSPRAYHRFQQEVMPAASSLLQFLEQNRSRFADGGKGLTEDGQMSIYEMLSVILTFLGLIGLLFYVHKTTLIAKASEEHNEIVTHPAVTVQLRPHPEREWCLDHVWILVENHTPIHAKMRILIEYEVLEELKGITVGINTPIMTGDYSGKEVWNIGAKDQFQGHTSLEKLGGRELKANEIVILNITADVSPFDRDDYRPIPLRQYRWKGGTSEWVPYPVPKK